MNAKIYESRNLNWFWNCTTCGKKSRRGTYRPDAAYTIGKAMGHLDLHRCNGPIIMTSEDGITASIEEVFEALIDAGKTYDYMIGNFATYQTLITN